MTKKLNKLQGITLFVYIVSYLTSLIFIYDTIQPTFETIILSFVPPVSGLLYLITLVPFGLRGHNKLLRNQSIFVAVMILITQVIYFQLRLVNLYVSKKILVLSISVLFLILTYTQIRLDKLLKSETEDISKFIDFCTSYKIPYFSTNKVKKINRLKMIAFVISICTVGISNLVFYFMIFIFGLLNLYQFSIIERDFDTDKVVIKLNRGLTVIEFLLLGLAILSTLFGLYFFAILSLGATNLKINFIKEELFIRAYKTLVIENTDNYESL